MSEDAPSDTREHPGQSGQRALKAEKPVSQSLIQTLPTAVWVVSGVLAAGGLFTANPILTPFAILMLPVLASLLWFPGEPPVLLFACLMQWLQGAAAIFYTDWHRVSLTAAFAGPELEQATWLSLIGILVLALGMRTVLWRPLSGIGAAATRDAITIRVGPLFAVYLTTYVVLAILGRFAWVIGGLQQPLSAAGALRWAMVFLIAYTVLTQRRNYLMLNLVVAFELFTGLLGFFSGFRSIFFVLLVALPAAGHFFRGWRLAQTFSLFTIVLSLMLVWSAVKEEYREFLNQGTGQQVVLVSVPDRIQKLAELVGTLNSNAAERALEALILRVSYVNYFALTLQHVPGSVPHEAGALWLGAVKHVLMPRFFFPDKPVINDSERTAYYSGAPVAGAEQGTSISIGYLGESYVDFGRVGMFVPVFALGLFYGLIYRFFIHRYRFKLMGFSFATAILILGACNLETSNIKLIGGNLMGLIVVGLFAKFVAPVLWSLITVQQKPAHQPRRSKRRVKSSSRRRLVIK